MARVPRSDYAYIVARALDVGARGVMVPMVNSVSRRRRQSLKRCATRRSGVAVLPLGFPMTIMRQVHRLDKIEGSQCRERCHCTDRDGARARCGRRHCSGRRQLTCFGWAILILTNFLGIPGRIRSIRKYLDALGRVLSSAGRKYGKGLGFMAGGSLAWAKDYQDHGFNMLACGTDHGLTDGRSCRRDR